MTKGNLIRTLVVACAVTLNPARCWAQMELRLECCKSTLIEGEPLVARVSVVNVGSTEVLTRNHTGHLQRHVPIQFVFRDLAGTEVVCEAKFHAVKCVAPPRPLAPGASMKAEKIVCPVQVRADCTRGWLPPGSYSVRVRTDLEHPLESAPVVIRIDPLSADDPSLRSLLDVRFIRFLEGYGDGVTPEITEMHASLVTRHPELPHREYWDFRTAEEQCWRDKSSRAEPGSGLELCRSFLAAYPNSPFLDNVLFKMAWRARSQKSRGEAIAAIERLLREFPDSEYSEDAQQFRTEMEQDDGR